MAGQGSKMEQEDMGFWTEDNDDSQNVSSRLLSLRTIPVSEKLGMFSCDPFPPPPPPPTRPTYPTTYASSGFFSQHLKAIILAF